MTEVLWAVLPEFQGRGYATEVAIGAVETAGEFGLERLVSLTLPDNLASMRVMEKAGFSFIGEVEHAALPHVLFEARPGSPLEPAAPDV